MTDEPWVVVPTAGRDTLERAIDSTGVPRSRVVLVVTKPNARVPSWCHLVGDLGEINIHRWWNAGLDYVAEHGGRYALVINDDVVLHEDTLPALMAAMTAGGTTLATPHHEERLATTPGDVRVLDGSCWLIDLTHGLRPDERFRWWFGDDDLDLRARRDFSGIALARTSFEHLYANRLTEGSEELRALADADARLWRNGE